MCSPNATNPQVSEGHVCSNLVFYIVQQSLNASLSVLSPADLSLSIILEEERLGVEAHAFAESQQMPILKEVKTHTIG